MSFKKMTNQLQSPDVTGGVYKARGYIHRSVLIYDY